MNAQALQKIEYGLYVLTCGIKGKDNGCIVNTVTQVAMNPARIAVAVNKQNLTHDLIAMTGVFSVSVIDRTASFALFEQFGFHTGRQGDKFAGLEGAVRGQNGLLHLTRNVCVFLEAKVISSTDLGTHTLFIAEVTDGDVLSEQPAMSYSYYHANVKPQPEQPAAAGWRCKICGYIYEGEELPADFVCPLCKHGAEDFEKI